MDETTIHGQPRQPGGRHATERLRRRGLVPAVIYGHNEPPETVAVSRHDLVLALQRTRHVVQVEVDGRPNRYLIKDVQYDHLQKEPLHVDFMRAALHERVRVKVAIELKGEPKGTHEGGELVQVLASLELECPLDLIPETLTHNVKEVELGQTVYVRDLALPPEVKALHNGDDPVAVVRAKRGVEEPVAAAAAPTAEAAGAEPEVIGKGKEESDEGGE